MNETPEEPIASPVPDLSSDDVAALYDGDMTMCEEGGEVPGTGKVEYQLMPFSRVVIRFRPEQSSLPDPNRPIAQRQPQFRFADYGGAVPAQMLSHRYSADAAGEATEIVAAVTGAVVRRFGGGSQASADYVRFCVASFAEAIGGAIGDCHDRWCGRLRLSCGPWRIILDGLPDCGHRLQRATASRKPVFTHIGEIRRADGSGIEEDEAMDVSEFLHWFLSFCAGRRVGIVLATSYAGDGTVLWQDWSPQRADAPGRHRSWFPEPIASEALLISEAAYRFWSSQSDRKWFKNVIGVYLGANRNWAGCELSFLWAMVALEMLAHVVLVEPRGTLTEEQCDDLRICERLRKLVETAGIPSEIPCHLTDLKTWAEQQDLDGPESVARLRNWLQHPTAANSAKLAAVSSDVRVAAWDLSVWYTELVLLRLFELEGRYSNRLNLEAWQHETEPVPWAAGR
jgi:hypothetical protein